MSIPENLSFNDDVNLEAIARLVVILENTPDENFNIGSWTCGTVHCAAGLAACNPWFNERGFHLDEDGDVCFKDHDSEYYPSAHWQAVVNMFNMKYSESEWLFSGEEYLSEYPQPERTADEQLQIQNNKDNATENMKFKHIPKSAVIGRLKQVLELHKYEIRPETNLS